MPGRRFERVCKPQLKCWHPHPTIGCEQADRRFFSFQPATASLPSGNLASAVTGPCLTYGVKRTRRATVVPQLRSHRRISLLSPAVARVFSPSMASAVTWPASSPRRAVSLLLSTFHNRIELSSPPDARTPLGNTGEGVNTTSIPFARACVGVAAHVPQANRPVVAG